MLFNSYIFIFSFLPVTLIGYFLFTRFTKAKYARIFLIIASLIFYGYFNYTYVILIMLSMMINYSLSYAFEKWAGNRSRKIILIIGLVFNLGLLGYYKYYDFFIENINWLFKANFNLKHILLPLGISFFTLQQISYIVDRFFEDAPLYSVVDYLCYVSFFPQLIAGPIVSHDELIPQFENPEKRYFNFENFSKGIYMFTIGLSKKVLLADVFGGAVDYAYNVIDTLNSTEAFLIMLGYTIQLYFDFSGYSDMAIGLGKMFNFDLPMNFNSPHKAVTIKEYWDRWHITLTRFFTRYIYTPISMHGVRRGKKKLYAIITPLIVFLISGFWHGANWTFVIWGLAHGIFVTIVSNKKKFFNKIHPALNWLITFGFVNALLVVFRAENFAKAKMMLMKAWSWDFGPISDTIVECFRKVEIKKVLVVFRAEAYFPHIIIAGYYFVAMLIILGFKNSVEMLSDFKPTAKNWIRTLFLLLWSIVSLSQMSAFLYFNF